MKLETELITLQIINIIILTIVLITQIITGNNISTANEKIKGANNNIKEVLSIIKNIGAKPAPTNSWHMYYYKPEKRQE